MAGITGVPARFHARDGRLQSSDVRNGARKLGSPEATKALMSFEGFREMLYLHGRKNKPSMCREDWERSLSAVLSEDARAIEARLGEANGGAIPDPKAPSSSGPTGWKGGGCSSAAGSGW